MCVLMHWGEGDGYAQGFENICMSSVCVCERERDEKVGNHFLFLVRPFFFFSPCSGTIHKGSGMSQGKQDTVLDKS